MTKTQLSKYIRMGRELRLIEAQLSQAQSTKLFDRVKSSDNEYPYTSHGVTITGIDTKRLLRLKYRRAYLKRQRTEIEIFVDNLEDGHMQKVIWARYIVGASWIQIGHMMRVEENSVRMASNRYLVSVCKV